MKLILQAIKALFRKVEKSIPKRLTELENDLYSDDKKIRGNMVDVLGNDALNDAMEEAFGRIGERISAIENDCAEPSYKVYTTTRDSLTSGGKITVTDEEYAYLTSNGAIFGLIFGGSVNTLSIYNSSGQRTLYTLSLVLYDGLKAINASAPTGGTFAVLNDGSKLNVLNISSFPKSSVYCEASSRYIALIPGFSLLKGSELFVKYTDSFVLNDIRFGTTDYSLFDRDGKTVSLTTVKNRIYQFIFDGSNFVLMENVTA